MFDWEISRSCSLEHLIYIPCRTLEQFRGVGGIGDQATFPHVLFIRIDGWYPGVRGQPIDRLGLKVDRVVEYAKRLDMGST